MLERRNEVVPADPVARDLEVLARDLCAVVERVAREEADVLERDERDVAGARR